MEQENRARDQARAQMDSIAEMVAALYRDSQDDAAQRIQEDPLEVAVRSGWHAPGAEGEPEEFMILLCTGGPAVRIRGALGRFCQPERAWLEYQDWGTPWTEYFGENFDVAVLLAYCQQFYFGD